MAKNFDEDSRAYRVKKLLDRGLPVVILLLGLFLFIEFFASSSFVLYEYKAFIQYSLLAYFLVELVVFFTLYESNKEFFRNHWIDILLTVPFFTALKGLSGIKVINSMKIGKALKPGKAMKGVKIFQKSGKFFKKVRKFLRKTVLD